MKKGTLPNWEQFIEFVCGDEGADLMEQHPGVVDEWLQAFNDFARAGRSQSLRAGEEVLHRWTG